MTKLKTSELTGAALDYMTGVAVGEYVQVNPTLGIRGANPVLRRGRRYRSSTDWSQGGPLIEAHRISVEWYGDFSEWCADTMITSSVNQFGSTPLIAACRAIVAANLGDEVDVPEELV